jgi:hypothetical protein
LPKKVATADQLYRDDLAHIHIDGYGFHWNGAASVILQWLRACGIDRGLEVDLGCGSGQWLTRTDEEGYETVGLAVDDAEEVAAVFDAAFVPLRSIYRPTGEIAVRQAKRSKEGTRLVAEVDRQTVAKRCTGAAYGSVFERRSLRLRFLVIQPLLGLVRPPGERRGCAG